MYKFGYNFWLVFLPFHIFGIIGFFYLPDYFLEFIIFWFLIGILGNGVAAHRYFAHGQFETYLPIKWMLGFLATLGAIGPVPWWVIQHKYHHLHSDTINDPHTPKNNNWFYVFYSWSFAQGNNQDYYLKERFAKKLMIKMNQDIFYKFFYRYHYFIIYVFCIILLILNPIYFLLYCSAYALDFFRLGCVNYFCHKYGYRNHDTNDNSTNNIILGYLTMGFGWHNNHHASPGKLILTEKWWEIDIEGYVGKLLSR
jgi:fatty-acid desaturase